MNTTAELVRLLQVRYPIVQGGMQWVGRAPLAAAVSNAGALGMISALTQPSPEALGAEIDHCRQLTQAPFGVNLTLLRTTAAPPYAALVDTLVARRVPIVETAGRLPDELLARLKAAGTVVIHKCTSLRHAQAAIRQGVDIVTMDGFECAGHPGEDDVPSLVLTPVAASALHVPILTAGGIADGRGMAAALSLGAAGVTMGTRLLCTQEAPVHDAVKQALVQATERDTQLILRSLQNSARVWRNTVAQTVRDLERQPGGVPFETLRPWVAGARGQATLVSGDVQDGLIWAGVCVGLIHDIPSCATLIPRLMQECQASLRQAQQALDALLST